MKYYRSHVLVCTGTGCTSSGARKIVDEFNSQVKAFGLEKEVAPVITGCFGLCALGPIVIVYPEGLFYSMIELKDVKRIVEEHLLRGKVVKELLYKETLHEDGSIVPLMEVDFYKKQFRLALKNCGTIDPDQIDEYIAVGGYEALKKALDTMTQQQVVDEIKGSGLRGRGGGGFPTGMKWQFALNAQSDQKYVMCNADEGDPGAFMDRSILEGDPHAIIEAMSIAGYAIGANTGVVYVRAEYPIACTRLMRAIDQARDYGILGKNIFDKGFDFDIEVRLGAGAFVCGEETALLNSVEGNRGEPKARPPFPAVKGLHGKPTLLNNVETLACVPQIIAKGAAWHKAIGTEKSAGTKVFALGGKVNNIGLIEVPMGITLREVVMEIGGGIPHGKKFKAAQAGGPSGGCMPASLLETPIDFDSLIAAGAMMGSGGLIVMDEDNCMVDIAKFFLEFTVDESCGKCPPCRIGIRRMLETLEKITDGRGSEADLDKLQLLASSIKASSLCALGQTAPNPVLTTLKFFKDEYLQHVNDKKCAAGVCKGLKEYVIDPEKCSGCTVCAKVCPVNAIEGKKKEPHTVDLTKCIKCGACIEKCKFDAITCQ